MTIYTVIALAIVIGIFYSVFNILKSLFRPNGAINDKGSMICPNCGTRGEPKTITKGSTGMELILWICFIVPGLIYSAWRLTSRQPGCPSCGQPGMISVSTPNGKLLLAKFTPAENHGS